MTCRTSTRTRCSPTSRQLSADEMEGRRPARRARRSTVQYITDQFKAIGLEPGNPGRHATSRKCRSSASRRRILAARRQEGRQRAQLQGARGRDRVQHSASPTRSTSKDSEIVFAGYGVQAPEFKWDDFKGLDVKGKTLIVLVNDPPVPSAGRRGDARHEDVRRQGDDLLRPLDLQVREGRRAGRRRRAHRARDRAAPATASTWCRASAASASIWCTPDKNMGRAAVEGWLSLDAATELFRLAGQDFDEAEGRRRHAGVQAGPARA